MADDKKIPDDYEYPPEEYYKGEDDYSTSEAESLDIDRTKKSFLSRRILFAVGFFLALGIVYLILSYRIAQRSAELSQPTPQPVISSVVPPTQPVNVQQPPSTSVNTFAAVPSSNTDMQRLMMQNQSNQQTIATLQNQIIQVQSQVNDLSSTISTLGNQIQSIVNEIRAISLDRATEGRNLSLPMGVVYHLKALVPGRAWIQGKDGVTKTVTLGDRLPGYGIIQAIDTDQGLVTTSSGVAITYGPKDS